MSEQQSGRFKLVSECCLMTQLSSHRIQQMLAALRYFAAMAEPRSMNMGSKRLTWGTITCLQDAGLIDPAEGGGSLQDSYFNATEVGRQILNQSNQVTAPISPILHPAFLELTV